MRVVETVAQRACRLLEPIPEEEWTTGTLSDGSSKCCGLGHYYRSTSEDTEDYISFRDLETPYHTDLASAAIEFLKDKIGPFGIPGVNDAITEIYPQATAKQRVMALIHDMIKAGL